MSSGGDAKGLPLDACSKDSNFPTFLQPTFHALQHLRDRITDMQRAAPLVVKRKRSIEVDADPAVVHETMLPKTQNHLSTFLHAGLKEIVLFFHGFAFSLGTAQNSRSAA